MSIIDETRFVERLHFFNGQRLFASDLQGLEEFNREMRWLHNQSLHQPGVGSGFSVNGEKGDRTVTIGPGYAIDSRGREIILTQTTELQVPPDAGEKGNPTFYDLTVSYPDDALLEEAEFREGVCSPRGTIRLREAPIFCWVELAGENLSPRKTKLGIDLQTSLKIRLARIEVLNCGLNAKVSIGLRQSARPSINPYLAAGFQRIGGLRDFTIVLPVFTDTRVAIRMIVETVDTSSAGFLATPTYSTHFIGPRKFNTGDRVFASVDQISITAAEKDQFELFGLIFIVPNEPTKQADPIKSTELIAIEDQIRASWQIAWMGVER